MTPTGPGFASTPTPPRSEVECEVLHGALRAVAGSRIFFERGHIQFGRISGHQTFVSLAAVSHTDRPCKLVWRLSIPTTALGWFAVRIIVRFR